MKSVCIGHNTGLGDHIIMSGAVRYLSRSYDKTFILCLPQRFDHVEFLYRDAENIIPKVMPNARRCSERHKSADVVYKELEKIYNIEKIYSFQYNKRRWAKWHREGRSFINMQYDAIGVPREEKQNSFFIKRDLESENILFDQINPPEDYAFACCEWSSGRINREEIKTKLPVIHSEQKTKLIFDWIKTIEKSKVIFSVDTSFFHLIQAMNFCQNKFYIDARKSIAVGQDYLAGWFNYN